MNISTALAKLFPSAVPDVDYVVQDDGDGAFIKAWSLPSPQPTEAELQAALDSIAGEATQKQAAWDAAAAAFATLPLGKQALWEQIRARVAEFIQAGDFASAYQTIATVPSLYAGMEEDRATFLALFK
jgi:hypothetical protein